MSSLYDEDGIDGPFERGMKRAIKIDGLPSSLTASNLLHVFTGKDRDALVTIAACAQLVLEREHGDFCASCGRRVHSEHEAGCPFREVCDRGRVETWDCIRADKLVDDRLVALRGGGR